MAIPTRVCHINYSLWQPPCTAATELAQLPVDISIFTQVNSEFDFFAKPTTCSTKLPDAVMLLLFDSPLRSMSRCKLTQLEHPHKLLMISWTESVGADWLLIINNTRRAALCLVGIHVRANRPPHVLLLDPTTPSHISITLTRSELCLRARNDCTWTDVGQVELFLVPKQTVTWKETWVGLHSSLNRTLSTWREPIRRTLRLAGVDWVGQHHHVIMKSDHDKVSPPWWDWGDACFHWVWVWSWKPGEELNCDVWGGRIGFQLIAYPMLSSPTSLVESDGCHWFDPWWWAMIQCPDLDTWVCSTVNHTWRK